MGGRQGGPPGNVADPCNVMWWPGRLCQTYSEGFYVADLGVLHEVLEVRMALIPRHANPPSLPPSLSLPDLLFRFPNLPRAFKHSKNQVVCTLGLTDTLHIRSM